MTAKFMPFNLRTGLLLGLVLSLAAPVTVLADDTVSSVTRKPTNQTHTGKFIWADLVTTDIRAAGEFYYEVFGWDIDYSKDGTFANARYEKEPVATLSQWDAEDVPEGEAQWLVSISVADLDAAAAWVPRAGGEIVEGLQELPERGRLALVKDSQGAMFMLLRATGGDPLDEHPEPNTWMWAELWTDDPQAAAEFYAQVLDYNAITVKDQSGDDVIIMGRDSHARASVVKIPWEGVEPNWLPYLRVSNVVATVRAVVINGGEVVIPPMRDSDGSQFAVVADPTGGVFALQQKGGLE